MSQAGITTRSAKRVSQAERAWHCQPRTKSSSPSLSAEGSGRRGASAPATAECQLGISSTPTCNRCCLASSASLAQAACGPSGRTRAFTIRAARLRNFDVRTGKASTHDAQYAALEERKADAAQGRLCVPEGLPPSERGYPIAALKHGGFRRMCPT